MTINSQTLLPNLTYFGSFTNAFRIKAHTLIAWGYQGAVSRIESDSHEETTITGYISEAIKNRLRAFDCPIWCEDFSVMENRPTEKEGCEGKYRPQPDLVIEGNMRGRPEYIFEAKRLKKPGYGTGKYLGDDGLGCFLSGKYAARYDEAAMLGYVQSDSLGYWQKDIQEKINQRKVNLNLLSGLHDMEITNDLQNEWLSVHKRNSVKRWISIFHILLDFRAIR
jgi:hypothetical protein